MGKITQLELLALGSSDHGRSVLMGNGLRGAVRVGSDGVVSVYVTKRYRFKGITREASVGTWKARSGKPIGMSLKAIFDRAEGIAAMAKPKTGSDHRVDMVAERHRAAKAAAEAEALERQRIESEREAALLRIEADKQEALLHQKRRLQDLAALHARPTVKDLFDKWIRLDLVQRADRGTEALRSFRVDVFPLIGDMAAEDVQKSHVQEIVDNIKARASGQKTMIRTAKKTLSDLRQMFGFALDRDYIGVDPTARIKKAKIGKDVECDRVLSEAELIDLFQKLPMAGMAETSQLALRIQLSTLTRIGEVLGAQWRHVDFERRVWTLPETKNGKRHDIWLSDFALGDLHRLKAISGQMPWLFPASRAKKDQTEVLDHVCPKTVTKQVGDRQRSDAKPMSGRSKHVDGLVLLGGKWTPHDLRRTGATMMAELGVLPDVVERCLNHTEEKKVKRIYQRAQYESHKRDAWRLLGERLSLLEARAAGAASNVVTLKAA